MLARTGRRSGRSLRLDRAHRSGQLQRRHAAHVPAPNVRRVARHRASAPRERHSRVGGPRLMTSDNRAVWHPADVASTNLGRFMKKLGIADFATLRARSIDEPEWFWDATVKFLGLEW